MIRFCIFILAASCCENIFQKQDEQKMEMGYRPHMGAWTYFQTTKNKCFGTSCYINFITSKIHIFMENDKNEVVQDTKASSVNI